MTKNGHHISLEPLLEFNVPGRNFSQTKKTVSRIFEYSRVKGQGHQVTKYGAKCSFGATYTLQTGV